MSIKPEYIFNLIKAQNYNSKQTPSGWLSFNAPCCPHNGNHRQDRLKRGGIRYVDGNKGIVYHCFNCNYSTVWKIGSNLSKKFQNLLGWIGIPDTEIKEIKSKIWAENKLNPISQTYRNNSKPIETMNFDIVELPKNSKTLYESLIENPNSDNIEKIKYLESRGEYIFSLVDNFYSTTDKKDTMNRRIIIPFYWDGEIVGYVGRSIDKTNFKYFGVIPKNYLFNTEVIKKEHKFILLVEGPFDAISINGIATLGDKCSVTQIEWLNSQNKEIIVIPDKDGKISNIEKTAIEQKSLGNKWSVSRPDWDQDVKDCSDAVNRYGRLYTFYTIFDNRK